MELHDASINSRLKIVKIFLIFVLFIIYSFLVYFMLGVYSGDIVNGLMVSLSISYRFKFALSIKKSGENVWLTLWSSLYT